MKQTALSDLPSLPPAGSRTIVKLPLASGQYYHRPEGSTSEDDWKLVTVEHGPSSGWACRSLRMGGSAECGFNHWSGEFVKVG